MAENDPQDPHSALASFGEELRREREIRGISLKEIADSTKISKRFLEAIERNDHSTLPAPVFTRGFVREYARYLGLNHEEMVNRYNYAAAGDDRIDQSAHLDRVAQMPVHPNETRQEPKRGIPPAYARVDRNIWILIVIVAALSVATWVAMRHKRDSRVDADAVAHPVIAPQKKVATPPVPEASTAQAAAASAPADDKLHLTVDFVAASWVTLEVDGKTVLNDEVARGQQRTFEATNRFRFKTIGNAAGLRLTLNGKELPPLGPDGKVLHDVTFDRATPGNLAAEPARSDT